MLRTRGLVSQPGQSSVAHQVGLDLYAVAVSATYELKSVGLKFKKKKKKKGPFRHLQCERPHPDKRHNQLLKWLFYGTP